MSLGLLEFVLKGSKSRPVGIDALQIFLDEAHEEVAVDFVAQVLENA